MNSVKQSDNICTVGYRNIWGNFTQSEINLLCNAVKEGRLCSTQYTERWDINHPERLDKYIQYRKRHNLYVMDLWGFYFDYPAHLNDRVWQIINTWMPLLSNQ